MFDALNQLCDESLRLVQIYLFLFVFSINKKRKTCFSGAKRPYIPRLTLARLGEGEEERYVEKYCSSYLLENTCLILGQRVLTSRQSSAYGAVMISFVKYSFIGGGDCRCLP
jgi:hypothetical protein